MTTAAVYVISNTFVSDVQRRPETLRFVCTTTTRTQSTLFLLFDNCSRNLNNRLMILHVQIGLFCANLQRSQNRHVNHLSHVRAKNFSSLLNSFEKYGRLTHFYRLQNHQNRWQRCKNNMTARCLSLLTYIYTVIQRRAIPIEMQSQHGDMMNIGEVSARA